MKKFERGITLVEVVVVIFIVALFTIILISDFPKMLRQLALSRVSYNFAQDLRKAQDLGLSGIALKDKNGYSIMVQGYGIYFNLPNNKSEYVIYADVAGPENNSGVRVGTQKYDGDLSYPLCSEVSTQTEDYARTTDCVLEVVDISQKNSSLYINSISNIISNGITSINFSPPGPVTKIDNLNISDPNNLKTEVEVGFKNIDLATRAVKVNTSGLINVQ